ncbi:MAG: DUF1553 domain-containing protein [Opitutus sp.]|nr:DUF1553 domain-containing protein [Opitutus sp.]
MAVGGKIREQSGQESDADDHGAGLARERFSDRRDEKRKSVKWLSIFIGLCAPGFAAFAAAPVEISKLPPVAASPIDFARDVQLIFEKNCYSCHGPEKQRSSYRLDDKGVALTGGEGSPPNIVPGKSAASPLIHYVAGLVEDMLMPSKGDPLTSEQIGILRGWIDQGAVWPDDGRATVAEMWRKHWSFQPLLKPVVPGVGNQSAVISDQLTGASIQSEGAGGQLAEVSLTKTIGPPDSLITNRRLLITSSNSIDAFIRAKLNEHGLALSPPADARTLIRRLSFDLIGLPPTPAEVDAFVADKSPDAYARLVDRLLASPRYGERWARHWLDVVKFAESDGFERNNLRPNAWPYRDYVIRAFNEDKPYTQFMREQLAGDALGVDEATGFIVGGSFDFLQNFEPPYFNFGQRGDELSEIVGTTSSAFMGLTVGCARCHDHKFDPISQTDYYAMLAVFQGVEHGERPMRPRNHDALMTQAAVPRKRIAKIDTTLAPFEPLGPARRVHVLVPGKVGESSIYTAGTARGQASDAGDELRLPTLNANFRMRPAGGDSVSTWQHWGAPPAGRFRVWLSWGVAPEHAAAVSLTLDGREIARVNQAAFADGEPAIAGEKRWSGFYDAGIHALTPESRLALAPVGTGGALSADAVLFEAVNTAADESPTHTPHLRAPVVVKTNEERFAPVDAKFVRFTVLASNTPEGYLDELEVFTAGESPRNVALKEFGAIATSPVVDGEDGNPFYVNDRRYNERAAWSSPAKGPGYVQIEFPKVERVDRMLWSRNRSDRQPNLDDHLITGYRIEVSVDGRTWTRVASSDDRLGDAWRKRVPIVPTLSFVPPARVPEIARLVAERRALRSEVKRLTEFPPVYAGKLREPGPTFRLHRGDAISPREPVSPGGLARFGKKLELPRDTPEQQRRLALADWLADPANPLPARVMTNRIWHYHFGTGLVDTPSDFGLNGAKPTHPELLDWLASEFVAGGWSIKALHRLILLSDTYRQSSRPHAKGLEVDGATRLLWRFPPRRLDAEPLRDAMLAVAGRLDLREGGPGFFLFEPDISKSNIQTYVAKRDFAGDDFRRMVYQTKPRAQLDDVFGAFDCPDAGQIAPSRTRSTTSLQAFNLLNSPFVMQQAATLAARLEREAGTVAVAQVRLAFRLIMGREPAAMETTAATTMIAERGLPLFCRALFNANEFITVH